MPWGTDPDFRGILGLGGGGGGEGSGRELELWKFLGELVFQPSPQTPA